MEREAAAALAEQLEKFWKDNPYFEYRVIKDIRDQEDRPVEFSEGDLVYIETLYKALHPRQAGRWAVYLITQEQKENDEESLDYMFDKIADCLDLSFLSPKTLSEKLRVILNGVNKGSIKEFVK